jgi:hypothetical protein
MPSSKKKNKKVMKGGRSCPVGSQKVCISKGELVKLLKRAAIKKLKTRKKGKKVPKANNVVEEEKPKTVYESIFGSKEEKPRTKPKTEKPKTDIDIEKPETETTVTQVTEEPASTRTETTVTQVSEEPVDTQPQKETSFLGSIFGSNDKTATPVAK